MLLYLLAENAEVAEIYEEAELRFKKAVEFSPTNYDLVQRLAGFYRDQYGRTGQPATQENSLLLYQQATELAPYDNLLGYQYQLFRD